MAIQTQNLTSLHSFLDAFKAEGIERHEAVVGAVYEVQGRLNRDGFEYEDWDEMKAAAEARYDLQ